MCGVFAVLELYDSIDRARFDEARDALTHRGPDVGGSIFLKNNRVAIGHRRLSILDLSDAANQPMQLGSTWISFNGEIYNYQVLRAKLQKEGCKFITTSDTEVLLHGYRIWGQNLCDYLEGMFAFAIWDDKKRTLFLARDHVGQKPLYYAHMGDTFLFASEIKAIQAYQDKELTLRNESLLDFHVYDCIPEPYTWYKEVYCLSAGHCMEVVCENERFKTKINPYWNFSPNPEPQAISISDAMEKMAEQIRYAVSSHMISDVEVGAFLSGGADSTCVVTLANDFSATPIKTFSIGFGSSDGDELPIVRNTVNRLKTIHQENIVTEEDFRNSIDSVLDIFDYPFSDTSLVPTKRVSELAAKDVKVVLTGDGGDEAFGGYNYGWYLSPYLADRSATKFSGKNLRADLSIKADKLFYSIFGESAWKARPNYLRKMPPRKNVVGYLGEGMREALLNYDIYWAYHTYKKPELDPFREAQWIHVKTNLPSKLLVKVDRCSMRHSLETRAPFLSHRLIETMLDLPTEIRNPKNDWYKGLFRTWLKGKISDEVLAAPKRGFATPKHWGLINTSKEYNDCLRNCVNEEAINLEAIPKLAKRPKLFWKYLQIEKAYQDKYFVPIKKM